MVDCFLPSFDDALPTAHCVREEFGLAGLFTRIASEDTMSYRQGKKEAVTLKIDRSMLECL
jgi:hypothetical protein